MLLCGICVVVIGCKSDYNSQPQIVSASAGAAQDAHDLQDLQAGGSTSGRRLPSGRPYDDVIGSIESNKTDASYATAFIDAIGPEQLTQIPLTVDDYFTTTVYSTEYCSRPDADDELSSLFGELLATASHRWSPGQKSSVATVIKESMDDRGEYGRATVLNAMLQGHDANEDGVSELLFDTDFLVTLGNELETVDWSTIRFYAGLSGRHTGSNSLGDVDGQVKIVLGSSLNGYSFDPLMGMLYAMISNGRAALTFLEPNGGTSTDVERVTSLMSRHEIGKNDWTDIWSGLADQTSAAHATEFADTFDSATPAAKGSAALTATVVSTIGEAANDLSDLSRHRLTNVVSAYPWSVDQAARTDGASNAPTFMPISAEVNGDPVWTYGMSYQPQYTAQGLTGVIQAISRDATDFETVVNSVAAFEQRRMIFAALTVDTETDGNGLERYDTRRPDLDDAIDANSATAGFFQAAARVALEGDDTAIDQRNRTIVDSRITSSCFIPGPGDKTSELERAILSYTQDRPTTLLRNRATETCTQNLTSVLGDIAFMRDEAGGAQTMMTVMTIIQLISLGIIPAKQANAVVPGLVDTDGQMDSSKLDEEAFVLLHVRFVTQTDNTVNPGLALSLDDCYKHYDNGYRRGNQ